MEDVLVGYKNANELCIQLISLATGILILSITFISDVLERNPPTWALKISWGCFLLSIIFGIWMMMSVTGDVFEIASDAKVLRALLITSDPEKAKAFMSEADAADPEKVKAAIDEAIKTRAFSASMEFKKRNIAPPAALQIITFVAGTILLIAFGGRTLMGNRRKNTEIRTPKNAAK